jgi:membrane protease YdiL (CAAX protease family)
MNTHAHASAEQTFDRSPSGSLPERVAVLLEVVAAFAVVHVSYRSFKHFTELGRAEGAAGLNFSPGAAMILFTLIVLSLRKRSFADYGLTLRAWRYNLNVGLIWGVLTFVGAALVIKFAHIQFDPITPPDMTRGLVASGLELAATFLLAGFLLRERSFVRRIPAPIALLVLNGLLLLPLALAWRSSRPLLDVLLMVLWLFFGAGFGEEIFFRGYIQSRVNEAFGRPWRFMAVEFGFGLIVSSLLFGLIHAMNTVDYFSGRWDFSWWWLLFNFFSGLFFGCMRERTGSIVAGGVQHGLFDVLARLPSVFK